MFFGVAAAHQVAATHKVTAPFAAALWAAAAHGGAGGRGVEGPMRCDRTSSWVNGANAVAGGIGVAGAREVAKVMGSLEPMRSPKRMGWQEGCRRSRGGQEGLQKRAALIRPRPLDYPSFTGRALGLRPLSDTSCDDGTRSHGSSSRPTSVRLWQRPPAHTARNKLDRARPGAMAVDSKGQIVVVSAVFASLCFLVIGFAVQDA